jgi:hypothetical protein
MKSIYLYIKNNFMRIIISEKQVGLLKNFIKESKQPLNENKASDESLVSKLISHAEKKCMESPELIDIQKTPNTEHDEQEGLKNFNVWTLTIRYGNNPVEYTLKPESFLVKKYSIGTTELGQDRGETFIITPEFSKNLENRISQMERTKTIKQKQMENQKSAKEDFVSSIVGE